MHWKNLERAVVAALLLAPAELPAQCAMCWQALANSSEGASLIRGFQDGILFLLVVPFLVVGIIGFRIYHAHSSLAQPCGGWVRKVRRSVEPPSTLAPGVGHCEYKSPEGG